MKLKGNININAIKTIANNTIEKTNEVYKKSTNTVAKTKDVIIQQMDVNGDGQLDIEDIIIMAFKVPGVKINRENFLKGEFVNRYDDYTIAKVLETTPMNANIPTQDIDKIAIDVIQNERLKVSGISAALGMPGGTAMAATIPADIAQYYGALLRVAQKLLYLYGFPQIEFMEGEQVFNTETMNQIILCLGVMFGVANANKGIMILAKSLGKGVEKQLINKSLTKGTIYPIVKQVAKWFGGKMTKDVFAGFVRKAIPVVGGVVGGAITYTTFEPCCMKLKETLENTYLSNPNYVESDDIIEVE